MIFICQETFPEHGRPHELLPDAQCLRGGPRREEGVSFGYWENILQKVPKSSCVPGSCTPSCTTARCSSISSDRCQSVYGENYFVSQSNKNPVMCLFVMCACRTTSAASWPWAAGTPWPAMASPSQGAGALLAEPCNTVCQTLSWYHTMLLFSLQEV